MLCDVIYDGSGYARAAGTLAALPLITRCNFAAAPTRLSPTSGLAVSQLCGGCVCWKLEVVDGDTTLVQLVVWADGVEAQQDLAGKGACNDARSWAVGGIRQLKWHEGNQVFQGRHGSYDIAHGQWVKSLAVHGFAVDTRTAGAAGMSVCIRAPYDTCQRQFR